MVALPTAISPTIAQIDAHYAASEKRDLYPYIRGSALGKCERHQWYLFRWAHLPEQFEGRMVRLFETGHREEERMVRDLKAIGINVQEVDPTTGQQFEVIAVDGHFMGHTDGQGTGFPEAPVVEHLLECKTHNAKSFAQLTKYGVAAAKPEHVAQMQIYMHLRGLTRAFYLAKCKDNDEYYAERIHYDPAQAMALIAKAERIKAAHSAPPRINDDQDWYECKFCASSHICHRGAFALRNCRTCLHSTPIEAGQWHCARHDRLIDRQTQRAGCLHHLYMPSLVAGDQIDSADETVTYMLPGNVLFVDGEVRV